MLLFCRSPGPHLEQSRNIHGFPIQPQFFFFALRGKHRHAVGELVAFSADMTGDMSERELVFYPAVDCITVLNNFQILDLAASFRPASLFPAGSPKANTVDGVR